jgi:hypothetical protein
MGSYARGARLSAFLFAIMLTVAAGTFAACDSGGDDNDSGDAPDDNSGLGTTTALAANAPQLEGGTVRSGTLGYSAALSKDWTILPTATLPEGLQDTFTAPAGESLPATIQVRCITANPEAGVEAALTQTSRAYPDATPGPARTIDGQPAGAVQYTAGQPPVSVQREDVLFASGRCAWTISYVTAAGDRDSHLADFERFLSTFAATQ